MNNATKTEIALLDMRQSVAIIEHLNQCSQRELSNGGWQSDWTIPIREEQLKYEEARESLLETSHPIEADNSETVALTTKLIEACRTERGGYTSKTLQAFGFACYSDAKKGWFQEMIGKTISRHAYETALAGRNKKNKL